ncbi:MAG: hypothetical protein A2042_02625 [Candidatus Schekmanbacteria bacterium GWA2_38_11]|uniref:FAD/NAD(P)-binding domain-containing protein n=1 Tax=Candidatus Schekmanbacteria bacterium GWA2_38_11 TaxID=1817876 RepID=A0A1F7RAP8_9BACT|nr:MAG: hypothetical protein A2042_02625 [Candidatus Schekmanbacteria bacterium GWA2_38_11]
MRYIIVGCGAAGLSAANAIRNIDTRGEVFLISDEFNPFYIRPTLTDFLSGELKEEEIFFKNYLASKEIVLLNGKRVLEVVPSENMVILSNGRKETYNYLLLATGAKPKLPQKLLIHREKIFTIKTFADVCRIKERIQNISRVVIFGGGYIAVELIRSLKRRGIEIIYLTGSDYFWPSNLTEVSREDVEWKLKDEGVVIYMDEEINDIIDKNGKEYLVFTNKGKKIQCQLIGAFLGLEPDIDFLADSGIKCDKGILVSEELRTNIANIYSSGDAAQVYDINKKLNRINFGWQSASAQGEIAGQNMAGENAVYISDEDKFFKKLYGPSFKEKW